MPSKVGRRIKITDEEPEVGLLGVKAGVYDVMVGDYGWDNGDLFIQTPTKRIALKNLSVYHEV